MTSINYCSPSKNHQSTVTVQNMAYGNRCTSEKLFEMQRLKVSHTVLQMKNCLNTENKICIDYKFKMYTADFSIQLAHN